MVKNKLAEAEGLQTEAKKLNDRAGQAKKQAEKLTGYVQVFLNGETFKTNKVAVSYRKSESIQVSCEVDKLPVEFIRTKTTTEADKTLLKKAIKDGAEIAGVELIEKQNIQIN